MGREGGIGEAHDAASGPDLAVILDTVELPILVISPDCRLIRFNRAATTYLHLTPEDVGRSAGDALTGISDLDKLCAQVMSDQTQHGLEIREGDRLFLLRIAPCNGPSGAVLTFTNVTAFRASLDQAIYEREYTKAILNTVIDPLVLLDNALRVQTANQAFYAMLRCSRDQVQNVPLCDFGDSVWKTSGLWESLKAIFAHDTELKSFEVELAFPVIGRRTVLVDARDLSESYQERDSLPR